MYGYCRRIIKCHVLLTAETVPKIVNPHTNALKATTFVSVVGVDVDVGAAVVWSSNLRHDFVNVFCVQLAPAEIKALMMNCE